MPEFGKQQTAPKEEKGRLKSFFNYKDDHNNRKWGKIARHAASAIFAATTTYSSIYIQNPNEKSLEITLGDISGQINTSGPHIKAPWPIGKLFTITTAQIPISIEAKEYRTGDNFRMTGGMKFNVSVNENADITAYYKDLNRDASNLEKRIKELAEYATVAAYESIGIDDLLPELDPDGNIVKPKKGEEKGFIRKLAKEAQEKLQAQLDLGPNGDGTKTWGLVVSKALPESPVLDAASETRLSEAVKIQQDAYLLALREGIVAKRNEVLAKEGEADSAYLTPFIAQGITDSSALASILCNKTASDASNANDPLTPGCLGTGGKFAAAVNPNMVEKAKTVLAKREATAQSAPAPAAE